MPERPGKADGGWRGCGIPIGYGRFGGYTWWVKSTCGSTRFNCLIDFQFLVPLRYYMCAGCMVYV